MVELSPPFMDNEPITNLHSGEWPLRLVEEEVSLTTKVGLASRPHSDHSTYLTFTMSFNVRRWSQQLRVGGGHRQGE